MSRRIAASVIALALLTCLLTGCGKENEYGKIEDVEITVGQEEDEGSSIFTQQNPPFADYKYNKVDFECAKFSFEVPDTWTQRIINQSCIKYEVPQNDPHFPGMICYVKCNYDYSASENELDPFMKYASEFSKPMAPYITGLPYRHNGRDVWIKSYTVADEQKAPSFCEDESAACIKVTKNLVLMNWNTGNVASFDEKALVAAYFRWDDYPVMMSIVVPNESAEDAERMMAYMMSSAKSIPQKIRQTKEYEYRGIKTVVPTEFQETQGSGNILRSPSASLTGSAGMAVGIFGVNEDINTITSEYFQNSYADQLASMLADPSCKADYDITASSMENEDEKLVDEKKSFFSTVNFVPFNDNYLSADKTYGVVSVWYMDSYFVERNGKTLLVAAMYPRQERELAEVIEKKMIESLSVEK